MKKVKIKLHEKWNFRAILDRLKLIYNFTDDKKIAQLFEITPQSLVNKRKAGTLLPNIIYFGIIKNVNLNWLLTGDGDPYINRDKIGDIPEDDPYKEFLSMTREILTSETDYSNSLAVNIKSFHRAIETEKKLSDHEKRLSMVEKKVVKDTNKIIVDVKEILEKDQPPEGIEERRESWIEMKKTFGDPI